jgi:hypothetical protein
MWFINALAPFGKEITMRTGRWRRPMPTELLSQAVAQFPWHASRKPTPFGGAEMAGGDAISRTAAMTDARQREPETGKPLRPGRPTTALSPLISPAMLAASVAQ